eukprot:4907994-Pleurochrysis_carterae.AAC.2
MQSGVQAGSVQTWCAAPTLTLSTRSDGSAAPADAAPQRGNTKGKSDFGNSHGRHEVAICPFGLLCSIEMIVPEDPK